MKNTLIAIFIFCFLFLSGCLQKQDAAKSENAATLNVEPTTSVSEPTASTVNISNIQFSGDMKQISIQDGVLTMDIPDGIRDPFGLPGSLYVALGPLENSNGEEGDFQLTVTNVFQAEEPVMDYAMFDTLEESLQLMYLTPDYSFTRIKDVTLNNTAKGFITHYKFTRAETNYDLYAFFIGSNGVYYSIQFLGPQDFVDSTAIVSCFDTLQIDTEKEADWVNNFKVKSDNKYYYSSCLDGAKVKIDPSYSYTENSRLIVPNAILGVTLNSNAGLLTVRDYPKNIYHFSSYENFIQNMVTDVINRGLFVSENPDADILQDLTDDGHLIFYYPSEHKIIILHFFYEYEDAYYVCELLYYGDDKEELSLLQKCAESFVAPGKETTPLFTPEDSDR